MRLKIDNLLANVPLVKLKYFKNNDVYSLMEKYNICGSIKVKTVYWILKNAFKSGKLREKHTVIEASSGNTAIALSYLSKIFNVNVEIVLPTSTSQCKKRLIAAYGAKIIEIDGTTDDCIIYRDKLVNNNPDKYFKLNQFEDYNNLEAHYHLTGKFIYSKIGSVDYFFAGLGTSGTLLGTAKFLKEKNPNTKVIAINPIEKIEGLRNFKTKKISIPFYNDYNYLIDEIIDVTYDDAIKGVELFLEEGYFVGLSSGAVMKKALDYMTKINNKTGVIIAPDGGDYYLDILANRIDIKEFKLCK